MPELQVEDMRLAASGGTEVTQALALDGHNAVKYEIMLTTATSIPLTGGVDVALEGSDDLENWVAESTYASATITAVSSVTYVPASGSGYSLAWRHVRLRITNNSNKNVLLGAAIRAHDRYF